MKLKTDGALQCNCWTKAKSNQTLKIICKIFVLVYKKKIQNLTPKCIENVQRMAKEMAAAKNDCVAMFAKCKKAEDASVRLISDCMHFDVQALNQSKIAEEAGSKITG